MVVIGAVVDDVSGAEEELTEFVHSVRRVFLDVLQTVVIVQRFPAHVLRQPEPVTEQLVRVGIFQPHTPVRRSRLVKQRLPDDSYFTIYENENHISIMNKKLSYRIGTARRTRPICQLESRQLLRSCTNNHI